LENVEASTGGQTTLPALVPPANNKQENPSWQRVWNPADRPNDKKEVASLSQALDQMLIDIGINPNDESHNDSNEFSVSKIEQEQKIYDSMLNDITR
jgi:hypothetical protein